MPDLPARRETSPAPTGTQHPARIGDTSALDAAFGREIAEMKQGADYLAHLEAVQSVVVTLELATTPRQTTAVCLALHRNRVTPFEASVIARALCEDPEFTAGTVRFGSMMTTGDWIGVWATLPRHRGRYSAEQCRRFVRLGYDRACFLLCDATPGATHPFCFVPTLSPEAPDA